MDGDVICLSNNVLLDDLVYDIIRQSSHEGIVDFIKKLDEQCQDWGVTEQLYEHFNDCHKIYIEEVKEDSVNVIGGEF